MTWGDDDGVSELDDAPEDPDAKDMDESDEPEVIACPYCGKSISEDAERCHHCGNYISLEEAPRRRWPWWIVLGFVMAFIVILMWVLM